jgi:fluoroquinolone resistance protein
MAKNIIEFQQFEKIDFKAHPLAEGEYDDCDFINCQFSGTNLSGFSFNECTFKDCDMSLAKITHASFRDVRFINCKLLGLLFNDCNSFLFSARFENCSLDHSSFYKMKLKGLNFINTSLKETDMSEADLTGALFDNCDLTGTVFENTILEKADLRTSHHYSIDPEKNRIKKAKFSIHGIAGLLSKHDIEIE